MNQSLLTEEHAHPEGNSFNQLISCIIAKLERHFNKRHSARYPLLENGAYIPIEYDAIMYFKGEGRCSKVYSVDANGQLTIKTVSANLAEIEKSVNPDIFARCHKSYLINVTQVVRCVKRSKGGAIHFPENIPLVRYSPHYKDVLVIRGLIR